MLVLGIDTSTSQVGVAVGDAGTVRGEVRLVGRRKHAEQLAPAIQQLCRDTELRLDQLAAIAVGIGPGLFTGLRVGVTTAKTMAQALQIPVVAVPSLDLVAFPLRHARRMITAVIDARRGEVFHARYQPVPGGVQRVSAYSVSSPSDLVLELESTGEETLLAGDGVERYRAEFDALDRVEHAGASFAMPSPSALVELATARVHREEFESPYDVKPMYLRESDAELSWDAGR